jgi:hypothetical protein
MEIFSSVMTPSPEEEGNQREEGGGKKRTCL